MQIGTVNVANKPDPPELSFLGFGVVGFVGVGAFAITFKF